MHQLDHPFTCAITVSGATSPQRLRQLTELEVTGDANELNLLTLTGSLPDQAALLGLLRRLYFLGLALHRVECTLIEPPHPTISTDFSTPEGGNDYDGIDLRKHE